MVHKIATLMVVASLLGMLATAVPVQSLEPPEPEAPRARAYQAIAPTHRYSSESGSRQPLEPVSVIYPQEPIKLLHQDRLFQTPMAQMVSPRSSLTRTYQLVHEPSILPFRDYETNHQRRTYFSPAITTTCTVTTTADSGAGSLRQCMVSATPGVTITFASLVFPPTAPVTITLQSPLPAIVTDTLAIDGSNAGVVLDGSGLSAYACNGLLVLGAHGVKIRGLQILNFSGHGIALVAGASNAVVGGDRSTGVAPLGQGNLLSNNGEAGILLQDAGTSGNRVLGNYIGTNATGSARLGNPRGIILSWGASDNMIGGDTAGTRNVISGNAANGIHIQNGETTGNQVAGNYIGTDATGTRPLSNTVGIYILGGAQNNTIGGTTAGARNVISGNNDAGISIKDSGTSGNKVQGNYIGTDATGTVPISNTFGIKIGLGAQNNVIGDNVTGARNIISGNGDTGVWIQNTGTISNQVLGNYIGVNISGTAALGNGVLGVFIGWGAANNIIGGDTAGARNIISGNGGAGILVQDNVTTGNRVLGNYIGTDATGTKPLSNTVGIYILGGAQNNTIGGTTAGARNVISGNSDAGIKMQDDGTTSNRVQGNYIGTDATGTVPLSNTCGVVIHFGPQDNIIGGDVAGARNIISGNSDTGVWIQNTGTISNQVLGNYIGTNVSGTAALGNGWVGVFIGWGAASNVIGGNTSGARNIISGNMNAGIDIGYSGTSNNRVTGNYIGLDASGAITLGNSTSGIIIWGSATNNVIGGDTAGARNVISGNGGDGIRIEDDGTSGNQMLGNYIGTDAAGMIPLGNNGSGIGILSAQDNIVGGDTAGARNIIAGNKEIGIAIQCNGTIIRGNYIGTNVSGTVALGNGLDGIAIQFGAKNNVVGGDASGARNVIGGNNHAGVKMQNAGTTGNQLLGNYIGTDATGKASLGNLWGVAVVSGAADNAIGGSTTGARNVISGNTYPGVQLQGDGTTGNQVLGNYIGTDADGTTALGNAIGGIHIILGANNNVIGGDTSGARNVISGNTELGINLEDSGTTDNRILGNYIGTDASGMVAVGNSMVGIVIGSGAQNNIVGGNVAGARNVISGNGGPGIQFQHDGTSNNQVMGNYIGTDATGAEPLGNVDGVNIALGASDNRIGGNAPGTGNLISGNGDTGVWLQDTHTTRNTVASNDIVTNTRYGIYLDSASENTIGVSNTIAYNGSAGVAISGTATLRNTITRNSIYKNGDLPIKFISVPVPVPAPSLASRLCTGSACLITGQACANCRIEIFGNPDEGAGGTKFLAETTTGSGGNFTVTVTCVPSMPYLSATATDPSGTTSEFFHSPPSKVYLPLIMRQAASVDGPIEERR